MEVFHWIEEHLAWMEEHLVEEIPFAIGGFVAWNLHGIYHKLFPAIARLTSRFIGGALRLTTRRRT